MCGRYSLSYQIEQMQKWLGVEIPLAYVPSYNIAPSQPVLAIADNPKEAVLFTWGFQPVWSKKAVINAQLEGVAEKPFWKHAKRCVILADGFYEWKKSGTRKQPYRITADKLIAFAAVYDDESKTAAIVTTTPNAVVKTIHDRMPVMLDLKDIKAWIENGEPHLLAAKSLHAYPVSAAVNNPRNNSAELIAQV